MPEISNTHLVIVLIFLIILGAYHDRRWWLLAAVVAGWILLRKHHREIIGGLYHAAAVPSWNGGDPHIIELRGMSSEYIYRLAADYGIMPMQQRNDHILQMYVPVIESGPHGDVLIVDGLNIMTMFGLFWREPKGNAYISDQVRARINSAHFFIALWNMFRLVEMYERRWSYSLRCVYIVMRTFSLPNGMLREELDHLLMNFIPDIVVSTQNIVFHMVTESPQSGISPTRYSPTRVARTPRGSRPSFLRLVDAAPGSREYDELRQAQMSFTVKNLDKNESLARAADDIAVMLLYENIQKQGLKPVVISNDRYRDFLERTQKYDTYIFGSYEYRLSMARDPAMNVLYWNVYVTDVTKLNDADIPLSQRPQIVSHIKQIVLPNTGILA